MNVDEIKLNAWIKIGNRHFDVLTESLQCLSAYIPITAQTLDDLPFNMSTCLDSLIYRFGKLQDLIGDKIFIVFLNDLEENTQRLSMLDTLNWMEKLGLLPNANIWKELRDLHSEIAHDDLSDLFIRAKNINEFSIKVQWLLEYWVWVKEQIKARKVIKIDSE